MKNLFFVFLLGMGLIGMSGCGEDCDDPTDPTCPNFDPCFGIELSQASIEMGTNIGSENIRFEGDTVTYGGVYFIAHAENAVSYKWTVGTDNRTWDSKEFSLAFSRNDSLFLRNNPILVTLIVEYETNPCFPNDNGVDTVSKYLHFRSDWESKVWGKWEGYRDNLVDDIYQIEILIDENIQGPAENALYIYNQYNEGSDCFHWYSNYPNIGYRNLENISWGQPLNWETCGAPYYRWNMNFRANVNTTDDTIVFTWEEWKYKDAVNCCDTIHHIFRGSRVQ